VMEDPGGAEGFEHGGWTFKFDQGAEGAKFKLDEVLAASMEDEAGFADKMNSMPKYVVSSTLEDADWNNSTVAGRADVAEEVAKLKEQPMATRLLVAGSAQLVQTLYGSRPGGRVPADGLSGGGSGTASACSRTAAISGPSGSRRRSRRGRAHAHVRGAS